MVTASGNPNLTIILTSIAILIGAYSKITYTSGSVYLYYDRVYVKDIYNNNVGGVYPGAVVILALNKVSSLVGDNTYFSGVESFMY